MDISSKDFKNNDQEHPNPDDLPKKPLKNERRKSLFSVVKEYNQTTVPNVKYKNQLIEEVKQWKNFIKTACTNHMQTPNWSYQESDYMTQIRSYVSDKPNLEEYLANNVKFSQFAEEFLNNVQSLNEMKETHEENCQYLINEIAQDTIDKILLE